MPDNKREEWVKLRRKAREMGYSGNVLTARAKDLITFIERGIFPSSKLFYNSYEHGFSSKAEVKNECDRPYCRGCRHYEPRFKVFDASGRKCAKVYYARGGMTLEEVGELYEISRERVRQIENQAIAKIQRQFGQGKLDELAHHWRNRQKLDKVAAKGARYRKVRL